MGSTRHWVPGHDHDYRGGYQPATLRKMVRSLNIVDFHGAFSSTKQHSLFQEAGERKVKYASCTVHCNLPFVHSEFMPYIELNDCRVSFDIHSRRGIYNGEDRNVCEL